jgi:predicted metal-binding protein
MEGSKRMKNKYEQIKDYAIFVMKHCGSDTEGIDKKIEQQAEMISEAIRQYDTIANILEQECLDLISPVLHS